MYSVTGEKLHGFGAPSSVVRTLKSRIFMSAGQCFTLKRHIAYMILVTKPFQKYPLRLKRKRWKYNIKVWILYGGWVMRAISEYSSLGTCAVAV
jgi:hypothetical protein